MPTGNRPAWDLDPPGTPNGQAGRDLPRTRRRGRWEAAWAAIELIGYALGSLLG